ncbi:MAG: CYTH domain-containing protein [Bacteroides sp.]|nr:CYTH domain-containing protein [Bacteroides sp.]
MPKEIERKFLVKDNSYKTLADSKIEISQGYLNNDPMATVRVRIANEDAFITIKNKNNGCERDEWEYSIPVDDAKEILLRCKCSGIIEKTRYIVGRWEVDEFHGRQQGLVVAEIELDDANENITLPEFISTEVTGDPRYYNSVLAGSNVNLTTFST